jgi:hypothetical protein
MMSYVTIKQLLTIFIFYGCFEEETTNNEVEIIQCGSPEIPMNVELEPKKG